MTSADVNYICSLQCGWTSDIFKILLIDENLKRKLNFIQKKIYLKQWKISDIKAFFCINDWQGIKFFPMTLFLRMWQWAN